MEQPAPMNNRPFIQINISRPSKQQIAILVASIICSLVLAAASILYLKNHIGLYSLVGRIDAFKAYYFIHNQPPDGYIIDKNHSNYNSGILALTLTKSGNQVVLTEQSIPSNLDKSSLFSHGTLVRGASGQAAINLVEGRVVGVMLPTADQIMVLINAPSGTDSGDVSDILKSLRPLR